jgi:hypothetical protein
MNIAKPRDFRNQKVKIACLLLRFLAAAYLGPLLGESSGLAELTLIICSSIQGVVGKSSFRVKNLLSPNCHPRYDFPCPQHLSVSPFNMCFLLPLNTIT